MKHFILFIINTLWLSLSYGQCTTGASVINSTYARNNGQRGVMFNLNAINDVTILCFDMNLYAGTTANYEIYYKTGSFAGFENNAAAWTLVGSTTALSSLGLDVPTPIPIMVNINIPAGQTYGFYVTNTTGGGTSYTDGPAINTLLASDANLTMTGGVGKSYPFGLSFNYRNVNAHVYYVPYNPLPVGLSEFFATPIGDDVRLNWKTATEQNNDYFTIERSTDLNTWEVVGNVKGIGNSSSIQEYSFVDRNVNTGTMYYRISQTDFDGSTEYLEVRAVNVQPKGHHEMLASPNPAHVKTEIRLSQDEYGEIQICDLYGRDMTNLIPYSYENEIVTFDLQKIEPTTLIITCGEQTTKVIKY